MIKRIIQNFSFTKESNPIKLGRWSYDNANLKAHFANHDNCGDIICKDPTVLKNTISQEKEFILKKKYKEPNFTHKL